MKEEIESKGIPNVLAGISSKKITSLEEWKKERRRLIDLVASECYGRMPEKSVRVRNTVMHEDRDAIGGKALYQRIMLHIEGDFPVEELYNEDSQGRNKISFDFPINITIPKEIEKPPVFLSISISPALVHEGMPLEEIIDSGYAVVSYYYQDIVPDRDDDWGYIGNTRSGKSSGWGAISKWAWAAGRIMDYIEGREDLDVSRVGITGASRLGKTALWAAINDTRFSISIPMVSGTGGISLYRKNQKESIDHLIDVFPYWFCENYRKYKGKENEIPFDSNLLVALMAPRYLYVCCADRDIYDDINADYLACIAGSDIYKLYGEKGFCAEDRYPSPGDLFTDGEIGYHLRTGTHYISRYDWQKTIEFRNKHHI